MLTEFNQFIKDHSLFNKNQTVLLALSGGKDSICLFYLLIDSGYSFSVAHCNFQLRGKESDEDQAFVEALAKAHGITCHVQKFNTHEQMKVLNLSLQETARALRYNWFKKLIKENKYHKLLTAHHLTDNTETFFINLLRNTGISGLHGIPFNSKHIARPLMFANHHLIENYLTNKQIKYREDSSNSQDKYLRNQIRHQLLPTLEQIQSDIHQTLFQVSQKVLNYEKLSDELMNKTWKKIRKLKDNAIEINIQKLMLMENASTFLYFMSRENGFNYDQIKQLLDIDIHRIGKQITSKTHRMTMERDHIIITPTNYEPKVSLNKVHLKIEDLDSKYWLNKKTLVFEVSKSHPLDLRFSGNLYLDYDKIKLPLLIRNWQAGDKIKPLGMSGHKNISDILTDQKVNHSERASKLVIQDQEKGIIALLPNIVSEDVKITDQTTQILSIQII